MMQPALGAAPPLAPLHIVPTHNAFPCISSRVEGLPLQPVPHHELIPFLTVEVVVEDHLVVTVVPLADEREQHPAKDNI